jgi:hypothetical protein
MNGKIRLPTKKLMYTVFYSSYYYNDNRKDILYDPLQTEAITWLVEFLFRRLPKSDQKMKLFSLLAVLVVVTNNFLSTWYFAWQSSMVSTPSTFGEVRVEPVFSITRGSHRGGAPIKN